jgi:hypothetical protein
MDQRPSIRQQCPERPITVRSLCSPTTVPPSTWSNLEPRLFEAMMEELADQELYRKAASRLADKSRAIEVGIDDL